jgi:hypothetical protein
MVAQEGRHRPRRIRRQYRRRSRLRTYHVTTRLRIHVCGRPRHASVRVKCEKTSVSRVHLQPKFTLVSMSQRHIFPGKE